MDTAAAARDLASASPVLRLDQPWVDPELARLYDLFPFDADIPLYLELSEAQGGRTLELGCGSGRLLAPLASAGHDVIGVDASPHMLSLAEERLRARQVPGTWQLRQADMAYFDVGARFDLAVVAVKTFSYLLTRDRQQGALASIDRHLRPGGLLALDLLNPSLDWLQRPAGSLRQDLCEKVPDGRVITRVESVVDTDFARQVRRIRSMYEVIDRAGRVTKRIVEWPFRYFYLPEIELLLDAQGFEVEAVHGGYAREPLSPESTVMLVLARKTT